MPGNNRPPHHGQANPLKLAARIAAVQELLAEIKIKNQEIEKQIVTMPLRSEIRNVPSPRSESPGLMTKLVKLESQLKGAYIWNNDLEKQLTIETDLKKAPKMRLLESPELASDEVYFLDSNASSRQPSPAPEEYILSLRNTPPMGAPVLSAFIKSTITENSTVSMTEFVKNEKSVSLKQS